MKISYNGLKTLINFELSPDELSQLLTGTGLEVEGVDKIYSVKGGLEGLVIGHVLECTQHPNADKLKSTKVDIGTGEILSIVCGAPNVAIGQKVVVATEGTVLYASTGETFEIKKSKIRGEISQGMLCSEIEIGIGSYAEGIYIADEKTVPGTKASEYFGIQPDYIMEIGLTPNRADAASHFGVARDIKAKTGLPVLLPDVATLTLGNVLPSIGLLVEDTTACPRFCGLEIRNVQVGPSPKWLSEFLESIGVNSINNLVDISNYVCHYLGQPMHIFDADKILGNQIVVRKPRRGEKIKTLDKLERTFTGQELAICDVEKPMAIAGVFGGENSGVSLSTKNIFLEVAYFNPDDIRRSATNFGIKTDASFRYERGTDPNMPPFAVRLATKLILEMAGGETVNEILEVYPNELEKAKVKLRYSQVERLLGKKIAESEIKSILLALDFVIKSETVEGLELEVPLYRIDVTREADILEEILRIHGFENIPESTHMGANFLSSFPTIQTEDLQQKISQLLAADGFHEMQTLSITKAGEIANAINLMNPLSEDLNQMRTNLLPSGIEVVEHNVNRRQKDVRLFEFGRTYHAIEGNITEKFKLGIFQSGDVKGNSWTENARKSNFYDIKCTVSKVLEWMKIGEFEIKETENENLEYGLDYYKNGRPIVQMGKVFPRLTEVKQEVFYAELDWAYLTKKYKADISFSEIPKFPEVKRDLSLVLDQKVAYSEVLQVAKETEKKLLKNVEVFDVYKGDKIDQGKKAYALSFTLQDANQTLTDKQIDKVMSKLMLSFEQKLGALIRK